MHFASVELTIFAKANITVTTSKMTLPAQIGSFIPAIGSGIALLTVDWNGFTVDSNFGIQQGGTWRLQRLRSSFAICTRVTVSRTPIANEQHDCGVTLLCTEAQQRVAPLVAPKFSPKV